MNVPAGIDAGSRGGPTRGRWMVAVPVRGWRDEPNQIGPLNPNRRTAENGGGRPKWKFYADKIRLHIKGTWPFHLSDVGPRALSL